MCEECERYKAEFAREAAIFEAAHVADVVTTMAIPLPVDHYLLRCWGLADTYPEFREKYGQPNENGRVYAWWFHTAAECAAFKQELQAFCKTLTNDTLVYDSGHEFPNLVKKRTVAYATLSYKDQEYPVRKDYGYGYPARVVIFDWEENNTSCDCNRRRHIEDQHPGTVPHEEFDRDCETTIFVTAFRIEYED